GDQNMHVGVGPAHPAMHGIIRIITELDGEVIRKADVEIGYLHRSFEKDCEVGGWNNAIPYTDRLNYVSPLINNFGYCAAVEKLLGITVTERCQYIRVVMAEISRICDHLTCVGASSMELGAFTVFLYMIKAREFLWELVEEVTGARLTISSGRGGGLTADLPPAYGDERREAFKQLRRIAEQALEHMPGGPINVDHEGRPLDPAAYVDQGKQGKTEGLLLIPITLSPNLAGQDRAAQARVNAHDKRVVLPPKETTYG